MNEKKLDTAVPLMENPWGEVAAAAQERDRLWSKSRTFLGDVWFRFRTKFTALLGLLLILVVLVFAVAGPYCSPYGYDDQNLSYVNIPPFFTLTEHGGSYLYATEAQKVIEVDMGGHLLGTLTRVSSDDAGKRMTFDHNGAEITLDYSSSPYTFLDGNGERLTNQKWMWNRTFYLGCDSLGRDMMSRLMFGARVSLVVAVVAAFTNLVIGVVVGSISAYAGGMVDTVVMRVVDIVSALPLTLYVILIMVFVGPGLNSIIIAIGTVYWVNMARVVRGEILTLKGRDFVLASRTIGSSTGSIIARHLVPNAMGPILVTLTMQIPNAIFLEAFLSFVGLGIPAPLASLGTMCNDALATLRTAPYQLFAPALLICVLMFGFNFVGDGMRDALDPKLKK